MSLSSEFLFYCIHNYCCYYFFIIAFCSSLATINQTYIYIKLYLISYLPSIIYFHFALPQQRCFTVNTFFYLYLMHPDKQILKHTLLCGNIAPVRR